MRTQIITRKEAISLGLKYYFTGVACKNGGVGERLVNDCKCLCAICKKLKSEENLKYRNQHPDKMTALYSDWATANHRRKLDYNKIYRRKNKEKVALYERYRAPTKRASKILATPNWANLENIKIFYDEATRLSATTGIQYHVDHIVPLNSKKVCGLHNEFNLQILPATENLRKSNRYWPGMS